MNSGSESYREAGVDITAGYKAVELMRNHVESTNIPGVLSGIGGFGGLFDLDIGGMERPVLVSSTDGVGTKLKIAFLMDKHDTVGIDCVAMCVNDIACAGAKPLFFLDYIAMGKNIPERVATIVSGIASGCREAGCALIGGETAEMPGFYPEDEYDLAGFSVGMVDYKKIIDGSRIAAGDVVIGIASSGLHSNGYSLVRRVFNIRRENLSLYVDDFSKTLGEELLTPTKIYVKPLLALMEACDVKAVSHITGGGFYENIPRMLDKSHNAKINMESIEILPVFDIIMKTGNISLQDMYNTFNMGVGCMLVVSQEEADKALNVLETAGHHAYVAGMITDGEGEVELC